tara:strand:- start:999 stop:1706 length:708 start_codon:yes stop_codon:yes gene_type:complete
MPQINLIDFFEFYAGEVQQKEGVTLLQKTMPQTLLMDEAAWVQAYRAKPEPPQGEAKLANPLAVPYCAQLDNPSGQGARECFSSSCAMVALYWGVIKEENEYHRLRPKYGDSTDASAQIRTLRALGLEAEFVQVGSKEKIMKAIAAGMPVPLGFLHHGHYTAPSGGGHWLCGIGFDDENIIVNDPYGTSDLENGTYPAPGTGGKGVKYPWKYFLPRWAVANPNDGWGVKAWLPGK